MAPVPYFPNTRCNFTQRELYECICILHIMDRKQAFSLGLFPKNGCDEKSVLSSENETLLFSSPPLKEKEMKRKNFDLNEIFTYNNLYESYKSVCKSCRSKYKKTFFHFFYIQI